MLFLHTKKEITLFLCIGILLGIISLLLPATYLSWLRGPSSSQCKQQIGIDILNKTLGASTL
jgi:hypothetical protein